MNINWNLREEADVTVLELSGRLTLGPAAAALRQFVGKALANGSRKILLNMAAVTYIDSAGLGELVWSLRSTQQLGGALKLTNASHHLEDLLRLTKLYSVFQLYDAEQDALLSFL